MSNPYASSSVGRAILLTRDATTVAILAVFLLLANERAANFMMEVHGWIGFSSGFRSGYLLHSLIFDCVIPLWILGWLILNLRKATRYGN